VETENDRYELKPTKRTLALGTSRSDRPLSMDEEPPKGIHCLACLFMLLFFSFF
jgi:hypothetical protein